MNVVEQFVADSSGTVQQIIADGSDIAQEFVPIQCVTEFMNQSDPDDVVKYTKSAYPNEWEEQRDEFGDHPMLAYIVLTEVLEAMVEAKQREHDYQSKSFCQRLVEEIAEEHGIGEINSEEIEEGMRCVFSTLNHLPRSVFVQAVFAWESCQAKKIPFQLF